MQRDDGVWDAALFDYEGVYGTELAMDKESGCAATTRS